MSNTSIKPSTRQWLGRWVSGQPHQVIGGPERPYLLRWYVIPRNPVFNVYVHKFLRSDDARALHDHPWWFVSLFLRGGYDEVTEQGRKRRRAGSIAFRPALWRHRVELLPDAAYEAEASCWTLIVTGRRVRTWGFWCKYRMDEHPTAPPDVERFVPWTEFGEAGCGEPS